MKRFAAITTQPLEIEGECIPPGASIATMTSHFDSDRIQALFDSRILFLIPDEELAKQTAEQSAVADEPDTELDEDDDATTGEGSESKPESEAPKMAELEQLAAETFPGLKPRLAIALYRQQIDSVSALRHYIVDNKDLIDLDGIGKAADAEIKAWLSKADEE